MGILYKILLVLIILKLPFSSSSKNLAFKLDAAFEGHEKTRTHPRHLAKRSLGFREVEKVAENFPPDARCTTEQCEMFCNILYRSEPFFAQCKGKHCFCIQRDELFPPALKEVLRKYTLFGIPQQYE